MPFSALLLVILAAVFHAAWNLLAKKASDCAHFVFLYTAVGVVVWAPFVALFYPTDLFTLSGIQIAALAASAFTHLGYSLVLQRAYLHGDLSVVYPLARGTGPLLSTLGAILIFGERPSALALCGALSVVCGVFLLAGGRKVFGADATRGARQGILTGLFIATYTLVDARAVSALLVPPLIIDFSNNVFRSSVLFPRAYRDWGEVKGNWQRYKLHALGVAILGPGAYLLVLHVLRTSPVSYVAPAREVSMLMAAVFGAIVLGEENLRERLAAALMIALGVAALALG